MWWGDKIAELEALQQAKVAIDGFVAVTGAQAAAAYIGHVRNHE